jgi:sodium/proline symporter
MIILSFLFFIVLYLLMGNLVARFTKSSDEDYLLGGRSFGRFSIALSAFSSSQSGFMMTGGVGMGYAFGFYSLYWWLGWFLGDVLYWSFFPERLNRLARQTESCTIPELMSVGTNLAPKMASVRVLGAILSLVFVGFMVAANLLAAGKVIDGIFGIGITLGIIITGATVLSYSARGGLKSSIPIQCMQAVLMIATALSVLGYTIFISPDIDTVIKTLNEADPLLLDITGGRAIWVCILTLLGIVSYAFCFNMSQPHFLVRLMAGKDPEEAKKAKWVYIALVQILLISMTTFGLLLRVLIPDMSDPEQGLPIFAVATFTPIVVGMVLGGIFAAVASSLDGLILVLSSALTVDLAPEFNRRMSQKFGRLYQISGTILITICVSIFTIFSSSTVWDLSIYSGLGLGVTFGPIVFLKVLKQDLNPFTIVVTMLSGLVMVVFWRLAGLDAYVIEILPGFIFALLVYALMMIFKRKNITPTVKVEAMGESE